MFKAQLKFQKILSYLLIGVFVINFVYALSMITHVYNTMYNAYDPQLEIPSLGLSGEKIKGGKLFYEMQPFNSALLIFAIAVILISLTYFITGSRSRRKYYIGNYISAGLITVQNIAAAVFMMVGISTYRAKYLQVDFAGLEEINKPLALPYNKSTFWFDIGYFVCALLIIAAVLVILNVMWKDRLMKQEDRLLQGGNV